MCIANDLFHREIRDDVHELDLETFEALIVMDKVPWKRTAEFLGGRDHLQCTSSASIHLVVESSPH
jgi:hypothetical protein